MSEVARSVRCMETTAVRNRPELTDQDLAILRFEKRWWRQAGAKEAAARARFGVSATRYYQQLNRLLDVPAAQAAEPELVKRLRRARDVAG